MSRDRWNAAKNYLRERGMGGYDPRPQKEVEGNIADLGQRELIKAEDIEDAGVPLKNEGYAFDVKYQTGNYEPPIQLTFTDLEEDEQNSGWRG